MVQNPYIKLFNQVGLRMIEVSNDCCKPKVFSRRSRELIMRYSWLIFLVLLTACSENTATTAAQNIANDPEAATGFVEKQGVTANQYMIAAATPAAAKAGEEILANGGTAIDAGVAVQAMLTLTEPESSGLGGGGFILYWHAAEQKLYTIDARETAPLAAGPDLFLDAQGQPPASFYDAVTGGRSVGTPGIIRGLEL